MDKIFQSFWEKRIETCREALEKNNFEVFTARDPQAAKDIVLNQILPELDYQSVSWGDSLSMLATGVLEEIEKDTRVDLSKTFEAGVRREEIMERRRQALLVDVFFTGSNALTESGKLINLDMIGNRVAGITFGPKHVIVIIGRNKIAKDLQDAMVRVKEYAAPLNAIRHPGWKTPCVKTSYCMDCKSPERICNTWTITEKSYPKKRIKVIIVNQDLGL